MRKTSLYLTDTDSDRLRRVAEREGRSQSDVIRLALAEYEVAHVRTKDFAMFSLPPRDDADGGSIADIPDDELMVGFGE
jgi:hypothetical protein